MASTIITKNNTTGTPGVSDLVQGELAINVSNGSLYYGTAGGTAVSQSFTFSAVEATLVNSVRLNQGGTSINEIFAPIASPTFTGNVGMPDASIDHAFLAADAVDGDNIADDAVDTEHIADDAIETAAIADEQVTVAKMANLADMKVLGNVSGTAAAPAAVAITDDDALGTSDTVLCTQGNVKAYADTKLALAGGTLSGNVTSSGNISASGEIYSGNVKTITYGVYSKSTRADRWWGPKKFGVQGSGLWNQASNTINGTMSRLFGNSGFVIPERGKYHSFQVSATISTGTANLPITASFSVIDSYLDQDQYSNPTMIHLDSGSNISDDGGTNYDMIQISSSLAAGTTIPKNSMIYPRFRWGTDQTSNPGTIGSAELYLQVQFRYIPIK